MKFSTLKCKPVVNINDGKILGFVDDLEFQRSNMQITGFLALQKSSFIARLFPFVFNKQTILIRVDNIISIGCDVILVKVN
ncbi:MAG: PRC-barrel domain-containing protein [Erysipelotrichaceae bacterium]